MPLPRTLVNKGRRKYGSLTHWEFVRRPGLPCSLSTADNPSGWTAKIPSAFSTPTASRSRTFIFAALGIGSQRVASSAVHIKYQPTHTFHFHYSLDLGVVSMIFELLAEDE